MKGESIWSVDELESVVACPACGDPSGGFDRYTQMHDLLEFLPGEWRIKECAHCRSLFLDPRPTIESIGKAYATYFTHNSSAEAHASDNGKSLAWKLANGYMNARYGCQRSPSWSLGRFIVPVLLPIRQQLDYFYRRLPRTPGRLLDVGGGNGLFLLRAKAAGWEVEGFEPDPVAAAAARKSGISMYERDLDLLAGAYDVVTTSHVIEHVHRPQEFLRQIFGLLRHGGMLWLATPNVHSLGHRWYGRSWLGLDPPRHLIVFSANALRDLLEQAGFTSIQFHRRGRGSATILRKSKEWAAHEQRSKKRLPPLLVDGAATLSPFASEELIVTAKKPVR